MGGVVEYNYGGTLVHHPIMGYVGGRRRYQYVTDPYRLGIRELTKIWPAKIGIEVSKLWYRATGETLPQGLKMVTRDLDLIGMAGLIGEHSMVQVFIEHEGELKKDYIKIGMNKFVKW